MIANLHTKHDPRLHPPHPLLDTEETSVSTVTPVSYADLVKTYQKPELEATRQLYRGLPSCLDSVKLEQLDRCRTDAWFVRHVDTGEVRVHSNQCHLRWCPMCAFSHAAAISRNVHAWVKHVEAPKLVTLTLSPNRKHLTDQLDFLTAAFRRFRMHPYMKRHCRGGIWFLQVTWSEDDQVWHPHIHVLIDANYLPQKTLCKIWLSVTRTSYVVDIRAVRNPEYAAKYVSRYVARPLKLTEIPTDRYTEGYSAFRSRRLAGTWGTARKHRLLTPVDPDKGCWRYIGSYADVTRLAACSSDALSVVQAWLGRRPLPFVPQLPSLAADAPETLSNTGPDPPIQHLLDWSPK